MANARFRRVCRCNTTPRAIRANRVDQSRRLTALDAPVAPAPLTTGCSIRSVRDQARGSGEFGPPCGSPGGHDWRVDSGGGSAQVYSARIQRLVALAGSRERCRAAQSGLSGARSARVWSAGPELAPGRQAAGAGCPGGEGDSGPQRVAPGRVSRARAARPAGCVLQSGPYRTAGQSAPSAELSGARCDK